MTGSTGTPPASAAKGRTTAASKRAAATATTNSLGRPRRAAVDASPYASTSTAGSPTKSPSKGKGKATPTSSKKSGSKVKQHDDAQNDDEARSGEQDTAMQSLSTVQTENGAHGEENGTPVDAKEPGPAAANAASPEDAAPGQADANPSVEATTTNGAPTALTSSSQAFPAPTAAQASAPDQSTSEPSLLVEPAAASDSPSSTAASTLTRPLPTDSAASTTSSSSTSTAPTTNGNGNGVRRTVRSTRAKGIDYANLDQHLPASVDRWISTIEARTRSGQIVSGFASEGATTSGDGGRAGWKRFRNGNELDQMGKEWIYGARRTSADTGDGEIGGRGGGEGMMEPFVVESPEGLGMEMPRAGISVRVVADLVGPDTPLEVIDCASQSSLSNWTLGQWADYYDDPKRDKVRNVISLEVSETKLGKMITAPKLVRQLDWVDTIWPEDMKIPGEYPRVQKYCLMSVERCWTDWHVDFAGSSVFYHVLRGGKTFFFIRPTPENLKAYEEWSGSSERQESTWLGDSCDRVYRMDLKEGNTAFIPTGWIHAVYTPADSLVIGGNFLHSLNIPTQLRVYEIELATKVPRKFRYPHFVKLLWLVARHYHALLAAPSLLDTPPDSRPAELRSPRVLEGLKQLSSFLIQQTTRFARGAQVSAERKRIARENVPWQKVPDPVALSREFRKVVLRAMGEKFDAECFLPHVAHHAGEEEEKSHAGAGLKRKASDALEGADAQAALSAKVKRTATTQPIAFVPYQVNGNGAPGDGEIIGRHTVPVVTVTRMEERIDPGSIAAPAPPTAQAVLSEIKESRSTQSVVRRWVTDPLDPTGRSGPVVETRTVVTIVERVKFPHPSMVPQLQQQPYARYDSTASTAYQQAAGIGPPAPPSITAVPGSLASVSHPHRSQNAEPYQPFGWPYQYDLPSSSPSSSATPQHVQNHLAHVPQQYRQQQSPMIPSQTRPAQHLAPPQQQYLPTLSPRPATSQYAQPPLAQAYPPLPRPSVGMDNNLTLPPLPNPSQLPPLHTAVYSSSMPPPPAPRRSSLQGAAPHLPVHVQQQQGSSAAIDARMAEQYGYQTASAPTGRPYLPPLPPTPLQQQQQQHGQNGYGGGGGRGRMSM
ncbi:hypothetical protein JCM10908_001418 [Rhodotorula pacifica]|uniref:[Histone H3]-lysine-36 demethylase n=1 Tax=Rhodotorula pacifica TaxID=1495444 RepID=UPI0031813B48